MDDCRQWHAVGAMARRGSSFGFMGMFGRSHDLRQLDQALRSVDVHPAVVPEAVKLTTVNLLKGHAGRHYPSTNRQLEAEETTTHDDTSISQTNLHPVAATGASS